MTFEIIKRIEQMKNIKVAHQRFNKAQEMTRPGYSPAVCAK